MAESADKTIFTLDADQWWQVDGAFAPLHALNDTRRDYIVERIGRYYGVDDYAGLKILDVGCGGGLMSEPLAALGAALTAIDTVQPAIDVARAHGAKTGVEIDYRCGDWTVLQQSEKNSFDIILALEVIEHVEDVGQFLCQLSAYLRSGGIAFISTLDRSLWSWLATIVIAERIFSWLKPGTHDWQRFITPTEMESLTTKHDLTTINTNGLTFSPFSRRWRIDPNPGVNYITWLRKG